MPWGSCPYPGVEMRGSPPLTHPLCVCVEKFTLPYMEVRINQTPLCYIIGYNILRYQALPWHISYQETVGLLGGGALCSAFSTYPTENIRAMEYRSRHSGRL